jgi:tetratricopeptide (TPR) repeat protein
VYFQALRSFTADADGGESCLGSRGSAVTSFPATRAEKKCCRFVGPGPWFAALLCAHVFASEGVKTPIDSALVCLVNQRYDAARDVSLGVLRNDERDADALYMLLTIDQTSLLDYESYAVEGHRFLLLADSVLAILKDKLTHSEVVDSVRCLFYIGNLYGGKSVILAKCGNWFQAAREALTSVSILKRVKEMDSTFYAAYLGIGVFNYYLSQNLGWLPFMADKSEQGLREIELATQARFPYNYAAQNSLCWILIDRGDFARADSIVDSALEEFPDNTIFLRIKMRIALWTRRYDTAIEVATHLAQLSQGRNPVNWSDLLSSYQVVVESNEKLGNTGKCADIAGRVLQFEIPETARKISYVRKYMVYMRSVQRKYGVKR